MNANTKITTAATTTFEQLERRQLFTATLSGGTLRITGTDVIDHITVKLRDNRLIVDSNGVRQAFIASKVKSIAIDARAGDDCVNVDARVKQLAVIKGGDGDDT